jgi:hypothetical protein
MGQPADGAIAAPSSKPGSSSAPRPEDLMIEQRRRVLAPGATEPDRTSRRALALSGGGIRSATFSLGVVQALAEARGDRSLAAPMENADRSFKGSLLSTFDYLSTVSGGGYLGGFLCSLFRPGRLRPTASTSEAPGADRSDEQTEKASMLAAADDAVSVLARGVPQRIRSSTDYSQDRILDAPLAWLRENGRYLMPTGTGDGLYALALALRNWLSVHFVIGTVLMALIALLVYLRAEVALHWPFYLAWEKGLLADAIAAHQADSALGIGQIWWSTLSVACIVPLATIGVALGAAFWLVVEREDGTSAVLKNAAAWVMLAIGVGAAWLSWHIWPDEFWRAVTLHWSEFNAGDVAASGPMRRLGLVLFVSAASLFSWLCYLVVALAGGNVATKQRVSLTRGLEIVLIFTLVLASLAVIDTLGQSLYLAVFQGHGLGATLSPAGIVGTLVWMAKKLAGKDGLKLPGFLHKLPVTALAGFAGIVIFALVGALWAMFVHWIIWGGNAPQVDQLYTGTQPSILLWTVGITVLLAFVSGFFPGFINLSSLQAFYGARLTRAYLGASNGERFTSNTAARSAAEPLGSDQLAMHHYYEGGRIKTLAPLHIINVTVNKTVDPAEQLVQRDRKGQPLAVLPCGIALDCGVVVDFPPSRPALVSSVARPLSVGQWIGTSGAAFSTGIGRETTLGMSLLMGVANVRLGTWWPTGFGRPGTGKIPFWPGSAVAPPWVRVAVGQMFKTQRYLSYELRASFHGTHRAWQYLSDGGHFENTAIYELLRSERRVAQIFASDNGADPDYHFNDLGNLIRLAKIDLHADIWVADPATIDAAAQADLKPLQGLFGTTSAFKRPVKSPALATSGGVAAAAAPERPGPCALLLYALKGQETLTQIVLIKPYLAADVPADVMQYAVNHAAFPQEPTADQFFDEAQWESYRALGYWQGKRIFTADVLKALDFHARETAAELGLSDGRPSGEEAKRA